MVHGSYVGARPWRWSDADTKSNPSSSARLASATGSVPGSADVETFTPNSNSPMRPPSPRYAARQEPQSQAGEQRPERPLRPLDHPISSPTQAEPAEHDHTDISHPGPHHHRQGRRDRRSGAS